MERLGQPWHSPGMKMDPLAALFAIALTVIIILGMIIWQLRAVSNFYEDHANRIEARQGD
jgi:uncharacterized iron-regulated membrane protein